MEEKQIIQVQILAQSHQLNREDFLLFNQLIIQQQLCNIKLPFRSYDDAKNRVLNIFLYYIISVQKNFHVFKEDLIGDKYRSLCTKEISDYYIRNKMTIQLYEFSLLISKIIAVKVQECAHIIYYLVYGRFASHPFINTLCGRKDEQIEKKKLSKKGRENTAEYIKMSKKKTLINTKKHTELQMEMFCRQLKNTLKHDQNTGNVTWKKDGNNPSKKYQTEKKRIQSQTGQSMHATERKTLNRGSSYNTFIPQRIMQDQNSSILQTLPFQRRSYQTCTNWNRKGLMRKQKFNQFFDISQCNINTKQRKSPSVTEQLKQSTRGNLTHNTKGGQVDFVPSNILGKINYENFKLISNELKAKNFALDKIRYECAIRKNKFNFQKPQGDKQKDALREMVKLCQTTKQSNTLKVTKQKQVKFVQFMQKNTENDKQNIENYHKLMLKKNFSLIQEQSLKELTLMKNFSYQPQMRNSDQVIFDAEDNQKPADYVVNLLRNVQSTKGKQNQDVKKLDYFSQTQVGFKKMNCKHKLQKYKSDYRKFMKTQLLDRIRQAS